MHIRLTNLNGVAFVWDTATDSTRCLRHIDFTPTIRLKTRFDALGPGNQQVDAVHEAPNLGSAIVGQENLEDARSWLGEGTHGLCHVGCVAKPPENNHAPSPDKAHIAE
jgi:hypothetical protein